VHRPAAVTAAPDPQEEFLAYTRSLFLQTPRPRGSATVDGIWDAATARKFRVDATTAVAASGRGSRGRRDGKRKAAAMEEAGSSKALAAGAAAQETPVASAAPMAPVARGGGDAVSGWGPLCGLEDDERALSYLHAEHRDDLETAKLAVMVNADQGYGE
jgi:hypothetical protein